MTAITKYIHCVVLLRRAAHETACSYGNQKIVLFTNTEQWTLS